MILDKVSLQKEYFPDLILVSGTGRNVGKTTFACSLISYLARIGNVTAIKISPHKHTISNDSIIFKQYSDYLIIEEKDFHTSKDTSRMLRAGAEKVYYIQSGDESLQYVLKDLHEISDRNSPIVCESGALSSVLIPGLFFIKSHSGILRCTQSALGCEDKVGKWISINGNLHNTKSKLIDFHRNNSHCRFDKV